MGHENGWGLKWSGLGICASRCFTSIDVFSLVFMFVVSAFFLVFCKRLLLHFHRWKRDCQVGGSVIANIRFCCCVLIMDI
jgi:hypothetical protein